MAENSVKPGLNYLSFGGKTLGGLDRMSPDAIAEVLDQRELSLLRALLGHTTELVAYASNKRYELDNTR
jgi:hypothetical protein